jgi:DNA-binding XRE family transcriptional regulator
MHSINVASPAQCRGARAILGWTQRQLAESAGVARKTIADFEAATRPLRLRTRRDITRALEAAGVAFTSLNGGDGVHFRRPGSNGAASTAPSSWQGRLR